nr:MAG TPA: hypothetical protein [Caudoviricetes sp.]
MNDDDSHSMQAMRTFPWKAGDRFARAVQMPEL